MPGVARRRVGCCDGRHAADSKAKKTEEQQIQALQQQLQAVEAQLKQLAEQNRALVQHQQQIELQLAEQAAALQAGVQVAGRAASRARRAVRSRRRRASGPRCRAMRRRFRASGRRSLANQGSNRRCRAMRPRYRVTPLRWPGQCLGPAGQPSGTSVRNNRNVWRLSRNTSLPVRNRPALVWARSTTCGLWGYGELYYSRPSRDHQDDCGPGAGRVRHRYASTAARSSTPNTKSSTA